MINVHVCMFSETMRDGLDANFPLCYVVLAEERSVSVQFEKKENKAKKLLPGRSGHVDCIGNRIANQLNERHCN